MDAVTIRFTDGEDFKGLDDSKALTHLQKDAIKTSIEALGGTSGTITVSAEHVVVTVNRPGSSFPVDSAVPADTAGAASG